MFDFLRSSTSQGPRMPIIGANRDGIGIRMSASTVCGVAIWSRLPICSIPSRRPVRSVALPPCGYGLQPFKMSLRMSWVTCAGSAWCILMHLASFRLALEICPACPFYSCLGVAWRCGLAPLLLFLWEGPWSLHHSPSLSTQWGNYLSSETLPQGQNLAPHCVETP